MEKLLHIGFDNIVFADRIVAVVAPNSAPMKRLREEARLGNKLIDATMGRRTRSIIITDSGHIVLSAVLPETLLNRLTGGSNGETGSEDQ